MLINIGFTKNDGNKNLEDFIDKYVFAFEWVFKFTLKFEFVFE